MENRIKKVMSEILNIDIELITDDISIGNVEKWDSLRHMNLVVALEEEFDIVLDDEDIEIIVSYPNICKVISNA